LFFRRMACHVMVSPDFRETEMGSRKVAKVGGLIGELKVKHFLEMPPELTGGEDNRVLFPPPAFLLVESEASSTMLFRFSEDGSVVGDTWHANDEDAIWQVEYEYGKSVGEWVEIPDEVTDVVVFARENAPGPSQE